MTPQGRILISSITNVEAAVDAVQRKVASFDSKALGPVKVTCLVIVGQRIIKSGLLDAFHAPNPGISIELLMEQSILDLSKGEADIAIRGDKPGSGALVCRKIADVPWAIYASRAFVALHGGPAEPSDITRFQIVDLVDELEDVPVVRWMRLHASQANVPGFCLRELKPVLLSGAMGQSREEPKSGRK
jgi:DNA-binding transcriptional LysR family regulator